MSPLYISVKNLTPDQLTQCYFTLNGIPFKVLSDIQQSHIYSMLEEGNKLDKFELFLIKKFIINEFWNTTRLKI